MTELDLSKKILNVNVGVLGHVDSGKTSLARALSTVASTASFDKSPQSKERGITLDLGFSAFFTDIPGHLAGLSDYSALQFTLVDCPGHATLIRTIMGGCQIIDMMLLVIDATKGIQTQTAESIVLGEVLARDMIVILNKVDLFEESIRDAMIERTIKKLRKTFEQTRFKSPLMIPVSCAEGRLWNVEKVVEALKSRVRPRGLSLTSEGDHNEKKTDSVVCEMKAVSISDPFIFLVDHCFSIRGQGTIMTGTVLQGKADVNSPIYIPSLKVDKKIKSIQMFRKPQMSAQTGDRCGISVHGLDASSIERGLVCWPRNAVVQLETIVVSAVKIRFHNRSVESKQKFHVTIGHATVMGTVEFFAPIGSSYAKEHKEINETEEYLAEKMAKEFTMTNDYEYVQVAERPCLAVIHLDSPVFAPRSTPYIASRLDTDIHVRSCRLAFSGRVIDDLESPSGPLADGTLGDGLTEDASPLDALRIIKWKTREGFVDRVIDSRSYVGRGIFKKGSDMSLFQGMRLILADTGEDAGVIQGSFGTSGKFKVSDPAVDATTHAKAGTKILLRYKKLVGFPGKATGPSEKGAHSRTKKIYQ
eukprot:TRINITY_DN336_c0_g1_i3.p1 TRINITY_DN336_c0_g1~~TRINITY_DN336_c0_g1_i3.p1  ORF type:complete len:588 (+),score=146.47 TRINITY_DN336_c0_g1_i3:1641-3404(+)